MVLEIGRLCVKIAGRDSRLKCVIVDVIDDNYVLIDGETRRRKCNIRHLEALDKTLDLKKGAAHEEVVHEFKSLGIEITDKKSKPKFERQKTQRDSKEMLEEKIVEKKQVAEKKPKKVATKKEIKAPEKKK
jgi:large subunit ribosomal protein L14e